MKDFFDHIKFQNHLSDNLPFLGLAEVCVIFSSEFLSVIGLIEALFSAFFSIVKIEVFMMASEKVNILRIRISNYYVVLYLYVPSSAVKRLEF